MTQSTCSGFARYAEALAGTLTAFDWAEVQVLAEELLDCTRKGRQVFLAGNGGSAANAAHLANDFLYACSKSKAIGMRVQALSANLAVLTCLANDDGYQRIFSLQLSALAQPGDVLIVLSGSGNSPNILEALEEAKRIGMKSYAILGYSGGHAKKLADVALHVAVDDMQIAEDMQLVIGHMLMQWLGGQRPAG